MKLIKRICFDKALPRDLHRQQYLIQQAGGRSRAISPKGKQWVNGSTIRIVFLGGTSDQQSLVRRLAPEWTEYANLNFEFTDDLQAEIRVSFNRNDGAWSYVGTDNLSIPSHAATLNLGWQDRGVILHEFGHMIGLGHEHQNPDGGIVWNEAAVIADLSGPPNYWDESTIRHNVLNKYTADQVNGTEFDPRSIMLYAFPDAWTQNMRATEENDDLSDLDKAFIASQGMYPGKSKPEDKAVELSVAKAVKAEISEGGEEDLFRFMVTETGPHIVQTKGSTDVVLTLFGPDSPTRLVAENDDGGEGRNSLINVVLQPGVYYARVMHYSSVKTGQYQIQVAAF